MMNQKTVDSPPHPSPLPPVENLSSWKTDCGGRGDNRKKIHSIISDRVKFKHRVSIPIQISH